MQLNRIHIAIIGICFLIFFSSLSCSGQDKNEVRSSVLMDFKLPTPLKNRSFSGVMSGLANIDLMYQYRLNHGIEIGAGFKYTYFDVNGNIFQNNVTGKMEGYNPFLKVAKRSNISERMFMEYSVRSGYNMLYTASNQCDDVYEQTSFNVEPQIGLYMKSSDVISFGLVIAYNYLNFEFTPDNLCMSYFPGVKPEYSVGNTQYFSIGFGFTTLLVRNKEN